MRRPLVLLVAFALAGCGEATTKDTADQPATTTTDAEPAKTEKPAATAPPKPKPRKAGIGDSITLTGSGGQKIRVKLLRLIDPVQPGEFDTPASGKRYVGVEIQLANVGSVTYKDSPGNGATIIYGADRQADSALVTGGECSADFSSDARIAPGGKRRGCIPFELPAGRKAKLFQFALDSGFADEGGEWLLRK